MIHLIAPKKHFRRAVDRNLVRRRVRAALDHLEPTWRTRLNGRLFLVPELLTLPFSNVVIWVETWLRRARII